MFVGESMGFAHRYVLYLDYLDVHHWRGGGPPDRYAGGRRVRVGPATRAVLRAVGTSNAPECFPGCLGEAGGPRHALG